MLKIKDNIDLKELEKFGFEYVKQIPEIYSYYTLPVTDINFDPRILEGFSINVSTCPDRRYIWIEDEKGRRNFGSLDVIFDLINAGLVEKV